MKGIAELTPQSLALYATSKVKSAVSQLPVGEHKIDCVVRVDGVITVGEDEDYTPTGEIFTLASIVKALHYMGVTRKAFMRGLGKVAIEAVKAKQNVSTAILAEEDSSELKDWIEFINRFLLTMPKKTRKGKVDADLFSEVLASNQAKADKIDAYIIENL